MVPSEARPLLKLRHHHAFEKILIIIIRSRKFITRTSSSIKHQSGAGSRQVAGLSMLIVNELGYQVRLEVALEAV